MLFLIEFFVILIQRVVGQVHVRIIKRLRVIILLSCKSHNAVTVKKNLHGTNHRRNQNIYPEIILVTVMERRLFNVFLNDVLILRAVNLS